MLPSAAPPCAVCAGWRSNAAPAFAAARRSRAAAARGAARTRRCAAAGVPPPADEGPGEQMRGGENFARMVRTQSVAADATEAPTEAADVLHAFWKRRGVRLEGQRRALVERGAAGGLFADTHALSRRLQLLGELLPGGDAAELAWREPEVLLLSRAELAERLAALRAALPSRLGVDVLDLVTRAPALLLAEGGAAAAGLARLQALFPRADVTAMLRAQPGVLLLDLTAGAAALRDAARRGAASEDGACAALCAHVSTTAGLHELLAAQHAAEERAERAARQRSPP